MSKDVKKSWYEDAKKHLVAFNMDPVLDIFVEKHSIGVRKKQEEKIEDIWKALVDPSSNVSIRNIVDYIDELKFYGKQRVFLFKVLKNEEDYNPNN